MPACCTVSRCGPCPPSLCRHRLAAPHATIQVVYDARRVARGILLGLPANWLENKAESTCTCPGDPGLLDPEGRRAGMSAEFPGGHPTLCGTLPWPIGATVVGVIPHQGEAVQP